MLYNTKKNASYRTRCQFSKRIIEKGDSISLFTLHDYNRFVGIIKRTLYRYVPEDIIEYIIEKTQYDRYINYWGLSKYVEFKPYIHRINTFLAHHHSNYSNYSNYYKIHLITNNNKNNYVEEDEYIHDEREYETDSEY